MLFNINMKKNCFIQFHLSTGDNFTMYALICHYQKIYENIYIFCLYRNRYSIKQMYEKYNNINIFIIEEEAGCQIPQYIFNKYSENITDYDIIKSGCHNENWNNCPKNFWRYFYTAVGIPYEIRYEYMNINRNYEREINLYNKLINKYGEKYIFVFDHRNMNDSNTCPRKNVDIINYDEIPIFHPNLNYYILKNNEHPFFNLWNENLMSDNLFDYGYIIEKSQEIIMNDSSFSCLCPYLNLKNIKKKKIYTNHDCIDYHNSFNGWEIIKY
jgi:hypothetical protein